MIKLRANNHGGDVKGGSRAPLSTHALSPQGGFTLIEMLIAMFILSFIAMAVYNNTTQVYKIRDSVENEGDFYNAIRVTLDVMGRDVAQIYTPKTAALPGDAGKAKKTNLQPGQPGFSNAYGNDPNQGDPLPFWGAPVNEFGVRPSRLQGEATKISFIANSHMRLFQDVAESDFAKITYALADPKSTATSRATTLVKRENVAVFDENDPPEKEVEYTLVQNVKTLKFRFLDGEKDQWADKWDTTSQDHKGKFPDVIEVTLEVFLPGSLQNTLTVVQRFKPEMVSDL